MESRCFNCASTEHKNYECTLAKSSGSAAIKKKLRQEFRQQNQSQQQKNMKTYMEKKEILASVLKESQEYPVPFYLVKKFVDRMIANLEDAENFSQNTGPVTICNIDAICQSSLKMKVELADLLAVARELFCYYMQVLQNLRHESLILEGYHVPPLQEQEILEARVDQMQTMKTTVWEKLSRDVNRLGVLQVNLRAVLTGLSQVDKLIFKATEGSLVLGPEMLLKTQHNIEDMEAKVRYLSPLCDADINHLKSELLRIRNQFSKVGRKAASKNLMNKAEEETKKADEEKCRLELKQDIIKLHQIKDPMELVKYMIEKYPPKSSIKGFTLDRSICSTNLLKKYYRKIVLLYHPDKQTDYDLKWKIMCEEITKSFTSAVSRIA